MTITINRRIIFVPLFILCLTSCNENTAQVPKSKIATATGSSALVEANKYFTYKGEPISPVILASFTTLADPCPSIMSIDVAVGNGSNLFFGDVTKKNGIVYTTQENIEDKSDSENYCYKWYGSLENGIHVAAFSSYGGGGSGVFSYLLLVKFSERDFDNDGEIQKQLLITLVKIYVLGDREESNIKLLDDKVTFTRDGKQKVVAF